MHSSVWIWTRDCPASQAEFYADGPNQAVAAYLSDVRDRMAPHIEAEDITDRESDDAIVGFRIVG